MGCASRTAHSGPCRYECHARAVPLEAEWVLSETMTRFLDNFNLLRMFRVARIIRSRAAMSSQAKPHMILLLADLKKMQPLYAIIIIIIIRCH